MAATAATRDDTLMHAVVPQLEAEGFRVFVQPTRTMLPSFLDGVRPDAVAFRNGEKLVVEVLDSMEDRSQRAVRLRNLLAAQADWHLRVFYMPAATLAEVPQATRGTIEARLAALENAGSSVQPVGALLEAWALFEAAARSLAPSVFARPQPATRLVDALAGDGYVTPDEADALRRLGHLRNRVAHGGLDAEPTPADVQSLVALTRTMLDAFAADDAQDAVRTDEQRTGGRS